MNLMSLQNFMIAPTSLAMPDHAISGPLMRPQSSLNMASVPQSPTALASKKGYRCTEELMLPENFRPTAHSVICGRGRKSTDAVGNRRLAVIASLFAKRYSVAKKKEEKSVIVSEILEMVRSASPDPEHAFVRQVHGRWFRVENFHAREKIGSVLRDTLHSKYRSSTKSKLKKRAQQKSIKMLREAFATTVDFEQDETACTSTAEIEPDGTTGTIMAEIEPDAAVSAFSLENELTGNYDLDSIF